MQKLRKLILQCCVWVIVTSMLVGVTAWAADTTTQPDHKPPTAPKQGKRIDAVSWLRSTLESLKATDEQKAEVRKLTDEAHKAREKWREDNDIALKALKNEFDNAVRDRDKERLKALAEKAGTLWATAPKFTETLAKIRNILTPEQQTAFDAAIQAKRDELGQQASNFFEEHPGPNAGTGRQKSEHKSSAGRIR